MDQKQYRKKLTEEALKDRPMGIFLLKNTVNNKMFIGHSKDIIGKKNSIFTQLRLNSWPDELLAKDYKEYGEEAFTYELLHELKIPTNETIDVKKELLELEQLYLLEYEPYINNGKGYNKPPK